MSTATTTTTQWHTEERARGLEPVILAYDLRNKCVRKHQDMVFSTKKYEKFSGKGAESPPQTLLPVERGIPLPTPHPLGACSTSQPDIVTDTCLICSFNSCGVCDSERTAHKCSN